MEKHIPHSDLVTELSIQLNMIQKYQAEYLFLKQSHSSLTTLSDNRAQIKKIKKSNYASRSSFTNLITQDHTDNSNEEEKVQSGSTKEGIDK